MIKLMLKFPPTNPRPPLKSPRIWSRPQRRSCLMVEAGMLEEIDYFTENLSRGFFVEKPGTKEDRQLFEY